MSDSPNLQNELAELDREVLGEESFYTPHSLRRKNHWLVTLRWYATAGLTGLLVIGYLFLPDRIPLGGGIVLVVILLAINLVFLAMIIPIRRINSRGKLILSGYRLLQIY